MGKHHDDFAAFKLTDEDKEAMHKLSKLPDIGALLAPGSFVCACVLILDILLLLPASAAGVLELSSCLLETASQASRWRS